MGTALTRLVENLDLPPKEAGEAILAYRAEVLREAADRLEAIDPIEFALGSTDPIAELRQMAQGDTP